MSPPSGSAVAIIVGAGRGTRFGASDKVLASLSGRPVLAHSLDAAQNAASIDAIVVVVGAHIAADVEQLLATNIWSKVSAVVLGGERRQDSVAAGIAAAPAMTDIVAIHDAARPLVTSDLFDRSVDQARTTGAAIVAIPVTDTLKRVDNGIISGTVSRDGLWAAQTPQAFDVAKLRRAFAAAAAKDLAVTDEAALFEALALPVSMLTGQQPISRSPIHLM